MGTGRQLAEVLLAGYAVATAALWVGSRLQRRRGEAGQAQRVRDLARTCWWMVTDFRDKAQDAEDNGDLHASRAYDACADQLADTLRRHEREG